jgi:hypothetical protein
MAHLLKFEIASEIVSQANPRDAMAREVDALP